MKALRTSSAEQLSFLLLAFFDGLGHVVRTCRVGEALARRGHKVVVGCGEGARAIVGKAGLPFVPVREVSPMPPEGLPPGRSRLAQPAYIRDCLEDELKLIDDLRPDAVLVDFRVTGSLSAQMRGVPSAWVANTTFLDFPLSHVWPQVTEGLESLGVVHAGYRPFGAAVLIPSVAWLEPFRELPAQVRDWVTASVDEVRFVGLLPSVHLGTVPGRATARKLVGATNRPLVYVTLGGLAQGLSTLSVLCPKLGGVDADVVVALGPHLRPEQLPALPGNVRVVGFTGLSATLVRAADVVVHHGGHTTTVETLSLGTPSLCIYQQPEQQANARQLARLGAGKAIALADVEDCLVGELSYLVEDKSVKRRCKQLASLLRGYDGAGEAASYLETLAGASRAGVAVL